MGLGTRLVQNLTKRGVKSSIITATSDIPKEFLATEKSLMEDSILFSAPEALVLPRWRDILDKETFSRRVASVVVDEAHCLSKW